MDLAVGMGFLQEILEHEPNPANTVFRLIAALVAGALVGLERESHAKPAGLRTYIVISVGACLLMLLSIFIPQALKSGDPGRIASQVVTGIGFLGAGAIIRFGFNIRGMTSAASIWTMAAIGMALGVGFYVGALVATLILLVTLRIFNVVEERLLGLTVVKRITVKCSRGAGIVEKVNVILDSNGVSVSDWNMKEQVREDWIEYTAVANITKTHDVRKVLSEIASLDGVQEVTYD